MKNSRTTYDSFIDISSLLVSKREEKIAREKAELLSNTDYLTGLTNRRAFEEQLELEINGAKREGKTLGIILIDIDHFKIINDTYGHQVGDMVLKNFASFLSRHSRSNDFMGRYGGEEFILCLPGVNTEEALKIAERLRQSVQEHMIPVPGLKPLNITASFGVAVLKVSEGENLESLIKRADKALYRAKEEGRNCSRLS